MDFWNRWRRHPGDYLNTYASLNFRKSIGMSSHEDTPRASFPIAIIGMSCRLPGAKDLKEFWTLLRSGGDAVGEIPKSRWDVDYYFHPDPAQPGRSYARAGGF